jgi:hypothetical protein
MKRIALEQIEKGTRKGLFPKGHATKEYLGKDNPNWKNGKYIGRVRRLRETIRKRDGYRCQECFRHQSELKRKLDVHHIDFNGKNNNSSNLISLCSSCHGQTKYNKANWINYFDGVMHQRGIQ